MRGAETKEVRGGGYRDRNASVKARTQRRRVGNGLALCRAEQHHMYSDGETLRGPGQKGALPRGVPTTRSDELSDIKMPSVDLIMEQGAVGGKVMPRREAQSVMNGRGSE
jgi:hypothetical protein